MEKIVHTFEPLYNEFTEILILGSFPSVKSREYNFYYMNPQNRFYKVLGDILDIDLYESSIENKKQILLKNKIGIYDVIKACVITGSSDASISEVEVSDINDIIKNSKVNKICLNGTLAYSLFVKYFPQYIKISYKLPSTSPANARYRLDDLIKQWSKLIKKID